MGNCCGTSSPSKQDIIMKHRDYVLSEAPKEFRHEEEDEEEQEQEIEYHDDHIETRSTTRSTNTPFLGTPSNDITMTTRTMTVLPLVDPRLVALLDFFRQLYARRKDIFNKIIPVHRQDLETIFGEMKKVQQLEKTNSKMGGVMRQRSLSVGDANELKNERFKVKPIDSGGATTPPKDPKGGTVSKPSGSKK